MKAKNFGAPSVAAPVGNGRMDTRTVQGVSAALGGVRGASPSDPESCAPAAGPQGPAALASLARKVCPNWMRPTGDAHYRDVLRALQAAYQLGANPPKVGRCPDCAPEFTECWNDGSQCRKKPASPL
jgi:hypothetical protein